MQLGFQLLQIGSATKNRQEIAGEIPRDKFNNATIPSISVLRKAVYELRKQQKLHDYELYSAAMVPLGIQNLDKDSRQFKGYVKNFDFIKQLFVLHWEHQLKIAKLARILFIEATGRVIKNKKEIKNICFML